MPSFTFLFLGSLFFFLLCPPDDREFCLGSSGCRLPLSSFSYSSSSSSSSFPPLLSSKVDGEEGKKKKRGMGR